MNNLRRAFSLPRNLGYLLSPPASRFRPVDGMRSLALLWVILMHCVWWQLPFLSAAEFKNKLDSAPRWILAGPFGVDAFFVISGFLIGYMLLDEHRKTGGIDLKRFYYRRLLKLMPAYIAALLVYAVVIGQNREMIWTNLLYINNFIDGAKQAMPWTWSLAIEEQFYLTLPLLLLAFFLSKRSWRISILVFTIVLSCAIRAVAVRAYHLSLPIPWSSGFLDRQFLDWAQEIYIKPYTRFGCLAIGVLGAYLYVFHDVAGWFHMRRRANSWLGAGVLAIALVALLPIHNVAPKWPEPAGFLTLVLDRNVLGAGCAFVLLYSMFAVDPVSRLVSGFLSLRIWYTIAQLAYSAYLLHPILLMMMFGAVAKAGIREVPMVVYYIVGPAISLLAASVLYLLVERPFTNLRETSGHALHKTPGKERLISVARMENA